jgi:hypothetical protein
MLLPGLALGPRQGRRLLVYLVGAEVTAFRGGGGAKDILYLGARLRARCSSSISGGLARQQVIHHAQVALAGEAAQAVR